MVSRVVPFAVILPVVCQDLCLAIALVIAGTKLTRLRWATGTGSSGAAGVGAGGGVGGGGLRSRRRLGRDGRLVAGGLGLVVAAGGQAEGERYGGHGGDSGTE